MAAEGVVAGVPVVILDLVDNINQCIDDIIKHT